MFTGAAMSILSVVWILLARQSVRLDSIRSDCHPVGPIPSDTGNKLNWMTVGPDTSPTVIQFNWYQFHWYPVNRNWCIPS